MLASAVGVATLTMACPPSDPPLDVGLDARPSLDAREQDAAALDARALDAASLDAASVDAVLLPDACPSPTRLCGAMCVDTSADPDHCGACDRPCVPPPGSIPFCAASRCVNAVCRPGFGNCDAIRTNGCEVDVDTSVEHCGRCDHPCEGALHAAPTCELGSCGTACEPGWADCDASSPGCECPL